jgi:hypothetical protein
MSTKTSIKRIALVAVAALGFGMVSTVTASAAQAGTGTNAPITIANTTAEKAVSCRVAVTCSIAIKGTIAVATATASGDSPERYYTTGIAAAFTSQPSGASVVYPTITGATNLTGDADLDLDTTNNTGSASVVALAYADTQDNEGISAVSTATTMATVTFVPSAVGTYKLTAWGETTVALSASSALSGSESYGVFTITVSAGVSTVTTSVVNGTSIVSDDATPATTEDGYYGSLMKVTIKDANGVVAALANGEVCSVDPSGDGNVQLINSSASGLSYSAGGAVNLAPGDFTNGVAWVNINDVTAETVTVTIACGSATGTATMVFKAKDNADSQWTVAPTALSTGWADNSAPAYTTNTGVSTISYTVSDATTTFLATEYAGIRIYDQSGYITGKAGVAWDQAQLAASSFSITSEFAATGTGYELSAASTDSDAAAGSQTLVITGAARNLVAAGITVSPSSPRAALAGSIPFSVTVKDQFGVAYANGRVTLALAGRNSAQATQSATTNSLGVATFTVTDTALATSTLTSDTVTITAYDEDTNATKTATITWSDVAVATVTLTAEDEDSTIAGTVSTDISAAAAGATGSSSAPYATVKDASGNVLAGVPVTFTISGLTGAEIHSTKVTVYTGADGVATTAISSYAAGKVTVTATAGGKSDTDYVYFKQKTATEARTIAATSANGGVMATVTDRYGNPIESVTVNATRASGTGFFANGSSSTSGTTDKNGQVEFKFEGAGSVKVAFTAEDYGQSADAAGKVGTTAVTAAAAGTTTANQKGLGASLAPAGVNSVTVEVAATTGATDAVDAANEATDAANAATDAANAAAEAADAATAAAQDAQAAVAALATQVASLIAGIKAQITTLTNLVIKIQKKVRA